jgi:hypothetical protein
MTKARGPSRFKNRESTECLQIVSERQRDRQRVSDLAPASSDPPPRALLEEKKGKRGAGESGSHV